MTQQESRLSRKVLDALKAKGIFAYKVQGGPTQMAGLPDVIACVDGKFVGIEMKVPGKLSNVSERQKYVHSKIRQAGGHVIVATSVDQVMLIIDAILDAP